MVLKEADRDSIGGVDVVVLFDGGVRSEQHLSMSVDLMGRQVRLKVILMSCSGRVPRASIALMSWHSSCWSACTDR